MEPCSSPVDCTKWHAMQTLSQIADNRNRSLQVLFLNINLRANNAKLMSTMEGVHGS